MKFRKKFKKILVMFMALSMLFCNNAFATPIDLANSEMDVQTDTLDKSTGTDYFADEENEWLNGTINEEVRVTVDLASQFEITIPKEIVLNGEDGTAQYKVKAVGDIAGDQKLSVVPDPDFVLSEAGGKADVTATVTQADTEYVYTDLQGDGTEYDGSIAATLTAGEWSGKFNFNIKFDGGESNTHICNADGRSGTSLFTLYEGVDDIFSEGWTLPIYNADSGDGTYVTMVRYDATVEEEQTVNINYDVNTTGMFLIVSDSDIPELILTSPGQTSGNVEINLKEGSNSVCIMMQGSVDDTFSTDLEGIPCCSICGHEHNFIRTTKNQLPIEACECGYSYINHNLNSYSWDEIATISEAGEAENYFSVGDTKEMTLSNDETYNAEIIGFNHDNLADGTGTAGITFQFKEIMNTTHVMNSATDEYQDGHNIGGWEASEMRSYVNNDVFALLPAELQAEIKTVDKVSDAGNKDTSTLIHTSDKLFLLSFEEVGFTSSDSTYFVAGQGEKYEKFTDDASRVKSYLSGSDARWWLRSARANGTDYFSNVRDDGSNDNSCADFTYGVAPAFCI